MSFRTVGLDGEMGIRGEEGAIDKDENSRRRNDVMQKRGQQSEKRLLKCE